MMIKNYAAIMYFLGNIAVDYDPKLQLSTRRSRPLPVLR